MWIGVANSNHRVSVDLLSDQKHSTVEVNKHVARTVFFCAFCVLFIQVGT